MNSTQQITYEDRIKYFNDDNPYQETPDVFELFRFYNQFFFEEKLTASFVRWSNKMTLCAGTCTYQGQKSCIITLSEPLLKYRSNNELKETLIHEMIHAYFFVTDPESCKIDEGHGTNFLEMMHKINRIASLNVSVYHKFHDEVDRCRQHVWKCNGPCQQRPPFFGVVKRSMNRPPQKADNWFERHQRDCGGIFHKIQSPEKLKKQQKEQPSKKGPKKQKSLTIDKYLHQSEPQPNPKSQRIQTLDQYIKKKQVELNNLHLLSMMMKMDKFQLHLFFEISSESTVKDFYTFYIKIQTNFLLLNPDLELCSINEGARDNPEKISDMGLFKNIFSHETLTLQMKRMTSQKKTLNIVIKKLILQTEIKLQLEKPLILLVQI